MKEQEAIEAEPVALVKAERVDLGMVRGNTPAALVETASAVATAVAGIVEQRQLYTNIGGKRHVQVSGWVSMLAMLGITPMETSVEKHADGSYTAYVSLVRLSDGATIGRGSAECGMDEPTWASRPTFARRSMAVTRATGKAARLSFAWIIELAGYSATPAEEMPEMNGREKPATQSFPSDAPVSVVPFGKNKNTPIEKLNRHQLKWYTEEMEEGIRNKFGGFIRSCLEELKRREEAVQAIAEEDLPFDTEEDNS